MSLKMSQLPSTHRFHAKGNCPPWSHTGLACHAFHGWTTQEAVIENFSSGCRVQRFTPKRTHPLELDWALVVGKPPVLARPNWGHHEAPNPPSFIWRVQNSVLPDFHTRSTRVIIGVVDLFESDSRANRETPAKGDQETRYVHSWWFKPWKDDSFDSLSHGT